MGASMIIPFMAYKGQVYRQAGILYVSSEGGAYFPRFGDGSFRKELHQELTTLPSVFKRRDSGAKLLRMWKHHHQILYRQRGVLLVDMDVARNQHIKEPAMALRDNIAVISITDSMAAYDGVDKALEVFPHKFDEVRANDN